MSSTGGDAFAVNERAANKKETREYPAGAAGAVHRAKDYVEDTYETLNKALKSALQDAGRFGARIPPTPRLPAIDCEEAVSRCIFVKVHCAQDLLAMDSGGTSDPLVVVRYRGLEAARSAKAFPPSSIFFFSSSHWDKTAFSFFFDSFAIRCCA